MCYNIFSLVLFHSYRGNRNANQNHVSAVLYWTAALHLRGLVGDDF